MISNQTHTSNTTELAETKQHKFHVKDPGSALTHFIAMIGAGDRGQFHCFTKRLEKQIRAILRRWLYLSSA